MSETFVPDGSKDRLRLMHFGLALAVFLCAFVPRAVYPVSRPAQWYTRSVQFIHDVGRGAFAETDYSEHPGVPTMWLAGTALRLAGVVPEQTPDGPHVDPASLTSRESAIGVLPLALAIGLTVTLMYVLLLRLFAPLAAISGAVLVALEPLFLSNSKVLHVDGLLAAFMVASALCLLVYLRQKQLRWAALSGVLGGLALLSKSPALFLLPYTGLCLGAAALLDSDLTWRDAAIAGLSWLGLAVLVYVVLFPAMWVDPIGTLVSVYSRAALRLEWAHPSPIFFLGQPLSGDPGPGYYAVVWACKLTALVAVFAFIAAAVAATGRRCPRQERLSVGLLVAFTVFFTVQMTLGAKKLPRYLLPAFPAAAVLAGVGLNWWSERLPSRLAWRRIAPAHLITLLLVLQAALVLPMFPYFGAHFNELVGAETGIWALSTQWQGEGLDTAAGLLNHVPGTGDSAAGSSMPTMSQQYFAGTTVGVNEEADWYSLGINYAMRSEGSEWGQRWDFYRRRMAWATVSLGAIPYARVFETAQGPQRAASVAYGSEISLVGYDLGAASRQAGQQAHLQLYWQAAEAPTEDYIVFVHLLDGSGQIVAQQDSEPVRGTAPTSSWQAGATVIDPYDVAIPGDQPPGELSIAVGMYRWPELTRLPAVSAAGQPLPDDRAVIDVITVTRPPLQVTSWIARGLALLVLASSVALVLGSDR